MSGVGCEFVDEDHVSISGLFSEIKFDKMVLLISTESIAILRRYNPKIKHYCYVRFSSFLNKDQVKEYLNKIICVKVKPCKYSIDLQGERKTGYNFLLQWIME